MTAEKSGEFRGKSVEAAIESGLMALGLSRDEAEIEIVRRGSRGVLGIGAEDAIVRITGRRPAPKEAVSRPGPKEAVSRPGPEPPKPVQKPVEKPEPQAVLPPAAPAVVAPVAKDARELEAAQRGRELLAGLLERMGMSARVEIVPQSEAEADEDGQRALVLNIVGEELGALVGRQGEVLTALQMLTRLMVSKVVRGRHNLIVDVNGYRARRAEALRRLALRMADQVMQAGRTMALEPMPPAERRIIHLTLRNHPSVTTLSVGEGDRRKVTIIPKKD